MEAVCEGLSAARFTCWRQNEGEACSLQRCNMSCAQLLPALLGLSQQKRGSSHCARPPTCNLHTELESNPEASCSEYKNRGKKNEKGRNLRKADSFMLVCGVFAAGDEFMRTNVSKHLERPLPPPPKRPPTASFCRITINLVQISQT